MFLSLARSHQLFHYSSPLVSVHEGNGWIISGSFKLVHIIDLQSYDEALAKLTQLSNNIKGEDRKFLVASQIQHITERIKDLGGRVHKSRSARSIDWLGSAWKWLAGSPDAIDWNNIVTSQNKVIEDNNHQYYINRQIFNITQEVVQRINEIVSRFNSVVREDEVEQLEGNILTNVQILKEEVAEIVRACQLAKAEIVNSNLLNVNEINRLVSEMETLPYQNLIEALEYAKPSILTNGTALLYVLSMPKVSTQVYHRLIVRAPVHNGKQVELTFNKMLVNHEETYGISGACTLIGNSTVCKPDDVLKLEEGTCLPSLLKGGNASCKFERNNATILEMLTQNIVFVSNYKGYIKVDNSSYLLNGTYVIQLKNETVYIGNRTFSSKEVTMARVLPAAVVKVTNETLKTSLSYVHEVALRNVELIKQLDGKINVSLATEVLPFIAIIAFGAIVWRCLYQRINLPTVDMPDKFIESLKCAQQSTPEKATASPSQYQSSIEIASSSYIDLRDADI